MGAGNKPIATVSTILAEPSLGRPPNPLGVMEKRPLPVTDRGAEFLGRAIEAWAAICTDDRAPFNTFRVKRKLAGTYTAAEVEEIARWPWAMLD